MSNVEEKFRKEIEVEQLWAVTEHGRYVFSTMVMVSMTLIFGLWDTVSHDKLLTWFALLTVINLFKWMALNHYHAHKEILFTNLDEFKHVTLIFAALTGLCWGLCVIWFLNPSQPGNALLVGVTLSIEIIGAMLTWTSYIPAIIAISVPAALPLVTLIFLQGSNIFIAASVILGILTCLGITSSKKLSGTLYQILRLNFENVSLRHETEEKSLLLETTLENMRQGISMSDKEDRLRMWNKPFIQLLGSAGCQVENDANLPEILAATNPPIILGAKDRTEYRLPNGQVYEIQLAELNQGGKVLTYTDITGLINREQAVEKARKEAEQANAAKTRFLAAASHDLRQPIHALGLFFGELSERVLSPETAKVIGQIEDSIDSINSMLNALLDISKLDAGIVKPAIETVDLNELFMRLQSEFRAIVLENHNELRVRRTTAIAKSDSAMLERMLRNLVGNASRYTENGKILLAACSRGKTCDIYIMDTGCGIPEDQLDEIFTEFHQLQNTARDRQKGLGLGLSIVKRLGKLLHHDIKVRSHPGRGSCFTITVPLSTVLTKNKSLPLATGAFVSGNRLAGCRILVLDDDSSVLAGMHGLLTQWGCQVYTADSQEKAIEQLSTLTQKITLLIIDYRLANNISGLDIAKNLQTQLGYHFEVLMITGDTGPERLREADASGYPLLHKPVVPAKLRSTLLYLTSTLKEVD
jgi:signal transduction histidine kinase